MLQFLKYNLKKRNFYYSLVLYFHFLKFKMLFFFQLDNIKYKLFLIFLNNIKNIIYMKINTSNILSIFNNNKFLFSIFKRDIFIVSTNNSIILNNLSFLDYLVMFCIDYYFINIKYLNNLNILYKLFCNNLNMYKIFTFKIFYILNSYVLNIKSYNNINIL